jgi:cytochrome o ubiquinol oxidase operon protein cyoD
MEWGISMHEKALALRTIGFVLSLLLTLISYFIIVTPDALHGFSGKAVTVIFLLALMQALVQVLFFLDLWREKGSLWNLNVFISTISIIFIIIWFSIWIMNNLNYRMMSM